MLFPMNTRKALVQASGFCLLLPLYAPAAEPFTEEAALRGISYIPNQTETVGQGVAFADLDDDGDPDIVLLGDVNGVIGIYENDGAGFFTDRSSSSGIGLVLLTSSVIAGDYDRDGDLDLYIARTNAPNLLLRNDGGFHFTNVAAEAGVADQGPGMGGGWGDYDNDGWLDLYLPNYGGAYRLYHNLGNGTFEDVAADMGVDLVEEKAFQASFFDFDRDGDADLFIATERGFCDMPPNYFTSHLFENVGGTFVEITDESGTSACVDAMCVALGDFDNNRYQDIYITNISNGDGNALLMNQGDGTFEHQEVDSGTATYLLGWGAVFFDFDNDGFLDLYVCNQLHPNNLFRHEGAWPCSDVASILDIDVGGLSLTLATADIDNDGDVDLLVENAYEPIRLFINNNEGQPNRWAKFDVLGEGPSRYAIGANIDVRTGADWQIREVIAGSNYKSQNELVQHFGLGSAVVMDEVFVMWPGGATRTLYNLPTNQTWTLYPTDKLGDGDHDGDHDLDDFVIFAACYEVPFAPGCEMMDFDGNSVVDLTDFKAFVGVFDGTPADCNDNGIPDMEEILLDPSLDADGDGKLDECDCLGDLDSSGDVGAFDLAVLLGAWGPCDDCPADLNGDGLVGAFDLALLLGAWGPCQ